MYIRYVFSLLIFALICGFMFSACDRAPEEEIMNAEDAIKSAINAGAEEESPKLLNSARRLLQDAKMLREQGNNEGARRKANGSVIQANKAEKYASGKIGAFDD